MHRQFAKLGLVAVVATVLCISVGTGQPTASTDDIYVRNKTDRTQTTKYEGELKLGPAGYSIAVAGKQPILVSPLDIAHVIPGDLPGVDRKSIDEPLKLERNKQWEPARLGYEDIRKKATNAGEKSRRFLDSKIATTTARVADETPEAKGWKEKAEAAANRLGQYLTEYKTGWDLFPMARTCARLQIELGQFKAAALTWAKVTKNTEVPPDLRQEAMLQEIDALIRAKLYPDASAKAIEAAKMIAAGPPRDRLSLLEKAAKFAEGNQAEGVKQLEEEIAKLKDPVSRAFGYEMIGELQLAANKPREAMWALLYVEVVYNQDRDEVAKTLSRLATTYQLQGDDERAASCRDKLFRLRASL